MSRAFVKEVDDAPLPPPLERAVSAAPNLVTRRAPDYGYRCLLAIGGGEARAYGAGPSDR